MSVSKGILLYKRSSLRSLNDEVDEPATIDVITPSVTVEVIDTDTLCKWCTTGHLIPCNAELICDNCGVINALYHSCDSDLTYIDGSMQLKGHKTVVNKWTPKSSISNYKLKQIGRKRIYVNTDIPYKERKITSTFKLIENKCNGTLDVKTIINIKDMYHKLTDNYIIKINKLGFIASIVTICCRLNNCPRSDQEIASMFDISISQLTKGMNKVTDRMVELGMSDTIDVSTTSVAVPQTFVNRFCTGLNITDISFINTVNSIITKITELGIVDSIDEASVTGAVILYVATTYDSVKVNKKDVHALCCTSIATINRCYKLIASNNLLLTVLR